MLQIVLGVAYPAIVLLALYALEPRQVALVLLGLAGLRLMTLSKENTAALSREIAPMAMGIVAVVAITAIWNDPIGLMLVPTLISLTLLVGFARSLAVGPPIIERFARMQVDALSDEEIAYCRRVTVVWCGFFVLNGSINAALAVAGQVELWALYTGLIAYLALGTLFVVEYVYRHYRFRRYVGAFTDPLLRRFFPPRDPEATAPGPETTRPNEGDPTEVITLDPALPLWRDHFPNEPILPGIEQVRLAIDAARHALGTAADVAQLSQLKFSRILRPGDTIALTVEPQDEAATVVGFVIRVGDEIAARGRIHFGLADAAPDDVATPIAPLVPAPDLASLVAHRASMRWLSGVAGHEEAGTRCAVDLATSAAFANAGDAVPTWLALEWMAQAISAHDNVVRRARFGPATTPRIGFLLGARRLELFANTVDAGARLHVDVFHRWGGDGVTASFDATVRDEAERLVARARLSCGVPPESASIAG